jgi:deazaflavin-dependent oxidoreductase (nitroreductase family)
MPDPDEQVLDSPQGWVARHVRRYLDSDGADGHEWRPGVYTLLLTSRGRRSGKLRRTALIYGRDGDRYLVVASVGGSAKHPAWYLNLTEHPEATVDVEGRTVPVRARELSPVEADAWWPRVLAVAPDYARYRARTDRRLPLLRLVPVDDVASSDAAQPGTAEEKRLVCAGCRPR